MEITARAKFLRASPQKLRLVARLLPGKKVDEALAMLRFMPQRGARLLRKVMMSAVANAEQRPQVDVDTRVVKGVQVDGGPTFRAHDFLRARAMAETELLTRPIGTQAKFYRHSETGRTGNPWTEPFHVEETYEWSGQKRVGGPR